MSGYADYDNIDLDTEKVINLPLVIATEESLAGLGRLVPNFEDEEVDLVQWPKKGFRDLERKTGFTPITEGTFRTWWDGQMAHAENHSVESGKYNVAIDISTENANEQLSLLTREMNYHPDGGQVIFPKEKKPFLVFLGVPGDMIQIGKKVEGYMCVKFAAFYFDGFHGLHINPNVWHQPPVPLANSLEFHDKQGAVHGCVAYDSVKENKVWLSVKVPRYLTIFNDSET